MEKSLKFKRVLNRFIGNSILFDKSDEVWAQKRKHLSSAFYKDKLNPMMETVISVANQNVQKWKNLSHKSIDLTAEVSDLVSECVLQCVFGESSEKLGRLPHVQNNTTNHLYPGQFLKFNFNEHMMRFLKIFR